jgi:hypothetical protein
MSSANQFNNAVRRNRAPYAVCCALLLIAGGCTMSVISLKPMQAVMDRRKPDYESHVVNVHQRAGGQ